MGDLLLDHCRTGQHGQQFDARAIAGVDRTSLRLWAKRGREDGDGGLGEAPLSACPGRWMTPCPMFHLWSTFAASYEWGNAASYTPRITRGQTRKGAHCITQSRIEMALGSVYSNRVLSVTQDMPGKRRIIPSLNRMPPRHRSSFLLVTEVGDMATNSSSPRTTTLIDHPKICLPQTR